MSQELSDTITYKGVRLSEVPGMAAQISALQQQVERLTAELASEKRAFGMLEREKVSQVNQQLAANLASERERRTFAQEACDALKRENVAMRIRCEIALTQLDAAPFPPGPARILTARAELREALDSVSRRRARATK